MLIFLYLAIDLQVHKMLMVMAHKSEQQKKWQSPLFRLQQMQCTVVASYSCSHPPSKAPFLADSFSG